MAKPRLKLYLSNEKFSLKANPPVVLELVRQLRELQTKLAEASMAASSQANYANELHTEVVALRAKVAAHEGWKLVPTNPTDAMRQAASKADYEGFEAGRSHGASGIEIYDAMLAAAPQPPASTTVAQDKMENPL